jgi:hypothetical protein
MARRRSSDEPAINLDSLMDALTNVVAVLVIVLMMLQLDAGNKVDQMLAELPQASPEQLAAREKEAAASAKALATLQKDDLLTPAPAKLSGAEKTLAELEASLKSSGVKLVELDALRKQLAETEPKLDTEKKLVDSLMAESQRLDALLNATPQPKAAEPTIVRIPDSRDIPRDAVEYHILCLADRVHLLDVEAARRLIAAELLRERNTLQRERVKQAGRDRFIYDQDKTVRHFEKRKLTIPGAAIRIPYNKPWRGLAYELVPDAAAGIPLADLAKPDGAFVRALKQIRLQSRAVVLMHVRTNAFPVYLKTRELVDMARIPAGWDITGADYWREAIKDLEVNNMEPPPPPPEPKPGDPQPIPPPSKKLD